MNYREGESFRGAVSYGTSPKSQMHNSTRYHGGGYDAVIIMTEGIHNLLSCTRWVTARASSALFNNWYMSFSALLRAFPRACRTLAAAKKVSQEIWEEGDLEFGDQSELII